MPSLNKLSTIRTLAFLPLLAFAQNATVPQCDPSSNGTTLNGTAGSELHLDSSTLCLINASDADQGVAVDSTFFYSIDNYSITKHHNSNGSAILQWYGGPSSSIIHLDGGVVINGTLYAPHSNYPSSPHHLQHQNLGRRNHEPHHLSVFRHLPRLPHLA